MLSILIPCYNYYSYGLVKTLNKQCIDLKIAFEILVSEDAGNSYININQKINSLDHCQYIINQTNLGRAGNINRLLKSARYNLRLILDCDVKPLLDNFIKTYLYLAKKHNKFVCFGGIAYQAGNLNNSLRYNYGTKREAKPAILRQHNPIKYLLTSNILLKNCNQLFDERIQTYGYEDMVFADELKLKNIKVIHLDNPVYHVNLEGNKTYLYKTQTALKTLISLEKGNILQKGNTGISKLYHNFRSFYAHGILKFFFFIFNISISKYLIKKGGPLWLFDLYKLLYFSKNY